MGTRWYVALGAVLIGWSPAAAGPDLGVCPISMGAEQADRRFHEGLDAFFDASNELIGAKRAWHRAQLESANERLETALGELRSAGAAFAGVPDLDADLGEIILVRTGIDENEVAGAFEMLDYAVPVTSGDLLDYFRTEVENAHNRLGDQEFTGTSDDYELLQNIGGVVQRAMELSTTTAALVAESHVR